MRVIAVRNVHAALPEGLHLLNQYGVNRPSRYGDVVVSTEPVTTVYGRPDERVIFYPERDANPFFHLFECLWMIAGRNDVPFLARFAQRMREFSDDGKTFHGAYGHRWRTHFGMDQLTFVARTLASNKEDRRCVVQMWDAKTDLGRVGKDFPCNTQVKFEINALGHLDMFVFNRSNDVVWGAYGANAVHFSFLQEYMAAWIGVPIGRYWQISTNFHAYHATLGPVKHLADHASGRTVGGAPADPYAAGLVRPFPIVNGLGEDAIKIWDRDLALFFEDPHAFGFENQFFRRVVIPMWNAHDVFKKYKPSEGKFEKALEILQQCYATDWQKAAVEWILRRQAKSEEKQ